MVLPAGGAAPTAGAPAVELRVRRTAITADDYLKWSPVIVQVKLAQPSASGQPVAVLLKNMDAVGGQLVFGPAPPSTGTIPYPTQPSVPVSLAADGVTWSEVVVAGSFGHASTRDKDAVLEVLANDRDLIVRQAVADRLELPLKAAGVLAKDKQVYFVRMPKH